MSEESEVPMMKPQSNMVLYPTATASLWFHSQPECIFTIESSTISQYFFFAFSVRRTNYRRSQSTRVLELP